MFKLSAVFKRKKKERVSDGCIHVYLYEARGTAHEFTCLQCGHKFEVKDGE